MPFENLRIEHDGAIAIVTIDRRQVMNALDRATIEQLRLAFLELKHQAEIRCLILTGAGDKAFVAGADIHELEDPPPTRPNPTPWPGSTCSI